MALLSMKPKAVLEVTPIFDVWTIIMGYCFMYSFTLTNTESFYGAVEVFRWLYVIGFIMLARSVVIKDDFSLTGKEISDIFFWSVIGILGMGLVNVFVSIFAKSLGLMAITDVVINTAAVDDLMIAFLAGYNEEIAFAAVYFAIYRLSPDRKLHLGPFQFNFAHIITMWAVAMVFPIFHSVAYTLWGPAFVVLFIGRLVLTEIMVRSHRIEPSILAHAIWDLIVLLPTIFIGA